MSKINLVLLIGLLALFLTACADKKPPQIDVNVSSDIEQEKCFSEGESFLIEIHITKPADFYGPAYAEVRFKLINIDPITGYATFRNETQGLEFSVFPGDVATGGLKVTISNDTDSFTYGSEKFPFFDYTRWEGDTTCVKLPDARIPRPNPPTPRPL